MFILTKQLQPLDAFFTIISFINIVAAILIPVALIASAATKNPETKKAANQVALAAVVLLVLGFGTCVAVAL